MFDFKIILMFIYTIPVSLVFSMIVLIYMELCHLAEVPPPPVNEVEMPPVWSQPKEEEDTIQVANNF